jgi:acyl dehydratase
MSEATLRPALGDELVPVSREIDQGLMNDYTFTLGIGNPIHHDAEFAARTEFGGPIASGPIALALVEDALAAAYPSAWLRSGSIAVSFLRPVRPGDTITTSLRVSEVEDASGESVIRFEVSCQNQNGTVVLAGTAGIRLPA